MTKKLFRGNSLRPLGYGDRKYTSPLFIVLAENADEAREIIAKEEPNALAVFGITEIEDAKSVLWAFHSYDKKEGADIIAKAQLK